MKGFFNTGMSVEYFATQKMQQILSNDKTMKQNAIYKTAYK
jgi:hypothetical protein